MKAYEIPNLRFSLPSGAAVDRHNFVAVDANGNGVEAAAGAAAIGVSMNKATAADQVLEIADGIVMVVLSGTVVPNDAIEVGANGTAIKKNTGIQVATALAGGVSGEIIAVKI